MGIVETLGAAARAARAVIGRPTTLPPTVLAQYPELTRARWRSGGLPPCVGGWCLGRTTVSAITLWRTVWLAAAVCPDVCSEPGEEAVVPAAAVELLLHELRHVDQFQASFTFPLRYLWESISRGYLQNRFEVDARTFAAARVRDGRTSIAQR